MRLTLPLPPTANRYWSYAGGRVRTSDEARAYKLNVKMRALQLSPRPQPLEGEVWVFLTVYRKWRQGDLDNFQKVLLDALKGVAFNDDRQVVEIHARREDDPSNPRVEVRVEAAQ